MIAEVFELMTGRPKLVVEPSAAPWTRRLTGNGACTFEFKLADMDLPPETIDSLFKERARGIAIRDGNTVAYAGVIMATDYDDDTETLKVETHEVRVFVRWRMLAGVNNITAADMHADGLSAAAAAGMIVDRITGWTGWEMPIDYTTTGAGDFEIENYWYDFRYAEDLFQDIEKRGYEVDLHPVRLSTGWYRWQLRVASRIETGRRSIPKDAPKSPITGLRIRTDAMNQVTGVLVTGKGEGTDKRTAWAGSPTAEGIAVADVIRDAGDIDSQAELQKIADATWAEQRSRIEQWSFTLHLNDPDAPVSLADALPGRRFRIWLQSNRRKPRAWYDQRVIALSGDLSGRVVKPEVQPWS